MEIEHLSDPNDRFVLVDWLKRGYKISDASKSPATNKLTRRDFPSRKRARRSEAMAISEGLKGMYSLWKSVISIINRATC